MLKMPGLYSIGVDYQDDDGGLVQKHADIAHSAAVPLEKCHLIKYKQAPGRFQSTELGRIASHYYVTYNSMGTYNQRLRPTMSTLESFRVFALLNEFKLLPVSLFIACSSLLLAIVFIFYQVRQEASNNYSSPY
jgi:pre-mRNA-splicing helicase BRR2